MFRRGARGLARREGRARRPKHLGTCAASRPSSSFPLYASCGSGTRCRGGRKRDSLLGGLGRRRSPARRPGCARPVRPDCNPPGEGHCRNRRSCPYCRWACPRRSACRSSQSGLDRRCPRRGNCRVPPGGLVLHRAWLPQARTEGSGRTGAAADRCERTAGPAGSEKNPRPRIRFCACSRACRRAGRFHAPRPVSEQPNSSQCRSRRCGSPQRHRRCPSSHSLPRPGAGCTRQGPHNNCSGGAASKEKCAMFREGARGWPSESGGVGGPHGR
jgi:hypothetical protein